jgi:filamentous hemagglutinin
LRSEVASGVGYGAIGGAASAAFSPDFLKAIDPTGAALDSGQQAALAGFATLLGGGLAGLAGANAQAGAIAAQNEALNNSGADSHIADTVKNGGLAGNLLLLAYTLMPGLPGNPMAQAAGSTVVSIAQGLVGQLQSHNGGNPPSTGAAPVTVCDPPFCEVVPASSGAPGNSPGNALLSKGGDNGESELEGSSGGSATGQSPTTNSAPFTPLTDGGGLQVYEDAGGHLIARHVGMSDADLANRLATSNVSAASTFADRATAETAVSAAIDANQSAIQSYLSGSSNGYLAIEYTSPTPVGTSLSRGATSSTPVNNVRVVITKDPTLPTGYRIVTGYPHQ